MTDEQIAALHEARYVLQDYADSMLDVNDREHGMVFALAHEASRAIFTVLNYTSSYGVEHLTTEQIQGPRYAASRAAGDAAA